MFLPRRRASSGTAPRPWQRQGEGQAHTSPPQAQAGLLSTCRRTPRRKTPHLPLLIWCLFNHINTCPGAHLSATAQAPPPPPAANPVLYLDFDLGHPGSATKWETLGQSLSLSPPPRPAPRSDTTDFRTFAQVLAHFRPVEGAVNSDSVNSRLSKLKCEYTDGGGGEGALLPGGRPDLTSAGKDDERKPPIFCLLFLGAPHTPPSLPAVFLAPAQLLFSCTTKTRTGRSPGSK